jgi:hypothetical protein
MLHFSTEELLSKDGNRPPMSFELLDDGITPLWSLKTIASMRMMMTQSEDLMMLAWTVPPFAETRLDLATVKEWVCGSEERHQACLSLQKS